MAKHKQSIFLERGFFLCTRSQIKVIPYYFDTDNDPSGATINPWMIRLKYNTIFIFILCLLDGTGHRLGQTCWQTAIKPRKRYMNG